MLELCRLHITSLTIISRCVSYIAKNSVSNITGTKKKGQVNSLTLF